MLSVIEAMGTPATERAWSILIVRRLGAFARDRRLQPLRMTIPASDGLIATPRKASLGARELMFLHRSDRTPPISPPFFAWRSRSRAQHASTRPYSQRCDESLDMTRASTDCQR